jgi:hypothetical protein
MYIFFTGRYYYFILFIIITIIIIIIIITTIIFFFILFNFFFFLLWIMYKIRLYGLFFFLFKNDWFAGVVINTLLLSMIIYKMKKKHSI